MKHISRIYIEHKLCANSSLYLDKESSHHLITVLRLKLGSAVIIFNGEGGEYRGELINADKRKAQIRIDAFCNVNNESPIYVELLQGIARNERMDIVMQKAVELGVSAITLVWTEYANVKIDKDKIKKRLAHWQKIIVNATEQSGRCVVAKLNSPVKLKDKLNDLNGFDLKLVCHPSEIPDNNKAISGMTGCKKVCILIGPEGGLSETEVNDAKENGFETLSLGPRILRTETAALAAVTLIQYQLGDI